MPRKKESNYRQAIERLRERHADKVEEVFLKMYDIALHGKEQKDSVNAAKDAVSLLGVPRAATEKVPVTKSDTLVLEKGTIKKPELPTHLKEQLTRLLHNGTTRS